MGRFGVSAYHIRMAKTPKSESNVIEFRDRMCFRLDDDVRLMLEESAKIVGWKNASHALNACLRQGAQGFRPPGAPLRIDPFEQIVFTKTIKRIK